MPNCQDVTPVILAGGRGTRLKPHLGGTPKVLANVGGRPFITYLLEQLEGLGFSTTVVCTGYQADVVEKSIGKQYGLLRLIYSHEKIELGTAGAVKNSEAIIKTNNLLVLNGDSYIDYNLSHLVKKHQEKKADVSILLNEQVEKERFGCVNVDANGLIREFVEKPSMDQNCRAISAGVYAINKRVLTRIPGKTFCSLEYDLFPSLIGNGLYGVTCKSKFIDIGTPESYEKAQTFFRQITG
jgi:D-glycero-alpha-D-manno-heptose 1-phosphate guanylyltransferase